MFQALPASIKKHLFYHNGAHVYLNNWQSIDFRESMNALLSKNCWATIQAMSCQLSFGRIIQENKVGLPWMILATKQVSAPSYSETVKSHPKPLCDGRLRALWQGLSDLLKRSLPRQGATGDDRSSNRRRPAPQRETSPSPTTSLQHQ